MFESNWMNEDQSRTTLIAGGGVAGLYCALRLAQKGLPVILLEASKDHWGGRIETRTMAGFTAEYGPMRFEPNLQPKFKRLLEELKLDLDGFPGPSAGRDEWPKYDLREDEEPLSSLDLLRLGVARITGWKPSSEHPTPQDWIEAHDEDDYDDWRRTGELNGQKLRDLGFWNALSAQGVLSHQALMKIRDTGTFYHLIPDNLNAAEWAVWWARALKKKGETMKSIRGGSRALPDRLVEILEGDYKGLVTLLPGARLVSFRGATSANVSCTFSYQGRERTISFARLILALPKAPLVALRDSLPESVRKHLDSVEGYPLLKVFFVTDDPWWDRAMAHERAARMPTREVHYFEPERGKGLVLVYTDRPATEYWKHYVVDKENHTAPEIDDSEALKEEFGRWLAREVHASLASTADGEDAGRSDLVPLAPAAESRFAGLSVDAIADRITDSVVTWGIRDWARPPFGGAFHGWVPGAESWQVIKDLSAFPARGHEPAGPRRVHICGEAYSSYQGFIEGSLRSADLALAKITKDDPSSE